MLHYELFIILTKNKYIRTNQIKARIEKFEIKQQYRRTVVILFNP